MDDFLPNDGSNYDPSSVIPISQTKEEETYKAQAESSYPIINDLIADFEADIAAADSLTGLGIDSSMPQIQIQIISEGNTKYINNLKGKLEVLKNMRDAVKR